MAPLPPAERARPRETPSEAEGSKQSEQFARLLAGKWVVQAIGAAAQLGLAEALDEPASLGSLARRLDCKPDPLERLLRVLAGEGLLETQREGHYALTPLGRQLRSGQQRELALFVSSPSQWAPWTELTHCVKSGECAFERAHGHSLFDFLAASPAEARIYDEAVDAFTRAQARELAKLDLLDEVTQLVDVGGGRGTLLLELLTRRADLRGTLVDRPHVVDAARSRFASAGLDERCDFRGGDFFKELPKGADAYVLKHVLHNWCDDRARLLLEACGRAAGPGGCVCVVEGLLLPDNRKSLTHMMDLEMFVLTGSGRERSKPEFRSLLSSAGLSLESTQPLAGDTWLLVSRPRRSK